MRTISGNAFIEWLNGAGIDCEHARRVVIDAAADHVVRIYIEKLGSSKLLQVDPPDFIGEVTVEVLDKDDDATSS